jgi:pilus assembly protein FimV
MFQDAAAAAQAPAAAPAATASATPARSSLHATPAFNDGDISIAPQAGAAPKSAADILAGAEDVLARSASTPVAAMHAAAQSAKTSAADIAGAATVAFTGALAAGKAHADDALGFGNAHAADAASELTTRVDTPAEQPHFDLDFQLDDLDQPAPARPAAESKPEASPTLASATSSFGHPGVPLELDKLDLSFDPKRPALEDPTPSVMDGQWHDAATKLDLAKAYQEMGDIDGAREILQEVLHEGDEQQKSEAQSLLLKLAS